MAKQERPGVMFYFDLRPSLKRLSLEEKGLLFESMLDYAQYGVIPELEGMIAVAWDFLQPRIDHDAERYEEISELRRKTARKRWDRQEEEEPLDANAGDALQAMPTTTTTSTTKTTTTATSSSTATTATAKPKPISSPRRGEKERSELIAVAEELAFEDLRRRKLSMLSGLMASG